jgi:endonuclease/exonuclease/phosphatase family metal-dependent hydrolase
MWKAKQMTVRRKILYAALFIALVIGIWLLNVSRPGSPHGCPQGCASERPRLPGPLRVLSLNVLHGRPDFENLAKRMDIIANEIIAQDADVVLLQEVPWTPNMGEAAQYLAERCGLNYLYLRSNGNRWAILFEEGSAILSRFELRNPSSIELRPRAAFFEHRVVLHAAVATDWGDVDVFVTHLTDGEAEINAGQLTSLRAFVSTTGSAPAVIGGDFNARENEAHIVDLRSDWVDAHLAANPGDPGFTCCIDDLRADPAENLEKRIDYIFLVPQPSAEIEIRSARTILDEPVYMPYGWQWASDHAGLLVELEIKP